MFDRAAVATGAALMVTPSEAVLFAVAGSASFAPTVAVFVREPADAARRTTCTATLAPAAIEPTLQVSVPEPFVQPAEAEINVTPDGSVSETVTPVAVLGPALLAVSVKTRLSPTVAGLRSTDCERDTSAEGVGGADTVCVSVAEVAEA